MNPEASGPLADSVQVPQPADPQSAVPQIPGPQPSKLRKVFVGKEGLRAGWSAVIFILIFAAFMAGAVLALLKLFPDSHRAKQIKELSLGFAYLNEGLACFAVLVSTWIMAKIERRGRHYGYGGMNKLGLFLLGAGSGILLISLLVFTLWSQGWLVIESRLIFGAGVLRYGFSWLVAFTLVGIFEESLTRGFLLYTMSRGFAGMYRWLFKTRHGAALGFWTAAVILSIIFFLGHTSNPGESPVGLLSVFLAGMFFSLSVWRTGSIWWGVGMHATWDWGQSFLYGVADSGIMVQHHLLATHPAGKPVLSGGTTGPEGSILVVAALAVGTLIIFLTLPKARYLEEPPADQPAQPANAVA